MKHIDEEHINSEMARIVSDVFSYPEEDHFKYFNIIIEVFEESTPDEYFYEEDQIIVANIKVINKEVKYFA